MRRGEGKGEGKGEGEGRGRGGGSCKKRGKWSIYYSSTHFKIKHY